MSTNAELLARRNAAVIRGVGHVTPVSRLPETPVDNGKAVIDFTGTNLQVFGDTEDFNNGVGQAGVRILSWREVR